MFKNGPLLEKKSMKIFANLRLSWEIQVYWEPVFKMGMGQIYTNTLLDKESNMHKPLLLHKETFVQTVNFAPVTILHKGKKEINLKKLPTKSKGQG